MVVAALWVVLVSCGGATGEGPGGEPSATPASAESPSPTPVPGEAVTFRTSEGVRIAGRLFGDGPVGVVLGHSIDGDQTEWWNVAEVVADAGHAAVAIDFRGYCPGDEAGCSEDGSTADAWRDPLAGATFLRERGVHDIVLIGASMGGTASVLAAGNARPRLSGVITLSAPTACCGMELDRSTVAAVGPRCSSSPGVSTARRRGRPARWHGGRGPPGSR